MYNCLFWYALWIFSLNHTHLFIYFISVYFIKTILFCYFISMDIFYHECIVKLTSCFAPLKKSPLSVSRKKSSFSSIIYHRGNLRRQAARSSEGNVAAAARETGGLGFIAKSVLYLVCLNTRKLYLRASFSPRPASCRDISWTCLWSNRLHRLYSEPQYDSAQNASVTNCITSRTKYSGGVSRYAAFCSSHFVLEALFLGANSASRGIIPLQLWLKGKGNARAGMSLCKLFKPVEMEDLIYYNYSRCNDLWNSRSAPRERGSL